MSTVLSLQLNLHQEIEELEREAIRELMRRPKLQKEKLLQEHCVNLYLEGIQERSRQLRSLYNDSDGALRSGLSTMGGPAKLSEFYSKLRVIKDRHRKHPNARVADVGSGLRTKEMREELEKKLESMFSGDENYGRYLDLNEAFELYVNLEHVPKVNSLKFLNVLDNFHEIPLKAKKYPNYEKYLRIFMEYLENFFKRQNPLFDYELLKKNTVEQFEIDWNNKNVKGWFSDDQDDKSVFCTACSKIIANQNVYEYHIEGSAHKRAEKASENRFKKPKLDKAMSFKDLARIEAILRAYLDKLSIIREETSLHAERKQTLTTDELMADALEEAEINESEEEDEKLYNPLKLPLGWDGKPIPYWLYKLHGLGVEYPCEICGNYVYMGRKAFDRHFQEWRHAHGMRCLGIPNTRHFQEITLIEDAYILWEKLEEKIKKDKDLLETTEEFEDSEGNVFNKKTYDDLKRQGLI